MSDLITSLENATEGSRELSDRVLVELGWRTEEVRNGVIWIAPGNVFTGLLSTARPNPTVSLDDALELVPEGQSVELIINGRTGYSACAVLPDITMHLGIRHTAATPALALCIALLKAKTIDTAGSASVTKFPECETCRDQGYIIETRTVPDCCGNTYSSGECRSHCAIPREDQAEIECPDCAASPKTEE